MRIQSLTADTAFRLLDLLLLALNSIRLSIADPATRGGLEYVLVFMLFI